MGGPVPLLLLGRFAGAFSGLAPVASLWFSWLVDVLVLWRAALVWQEALDKQQQPQHNVHGPRGHGHSSFVYYTEYTIHAACRSVLPPVMLR